MRKRYGPTSMQRERGRSCPVEKEKNNATHVCRILVMEAQRLALQALKCERGIGFQRAGMHVVDRLIRVTLPLELRLFFPLVAAILSRERRSPFDAGLVAAILSRERRSQFDAGLAAVILSREC